MEPKTLEALKASIAKWEDKATAQSLDTIGIGAAYCPLCALFNNGLRNDNCVGCPVCEKTGSNYCGGTPFDHAETLYFRWFVDRSEQVAERFRTAAQAEVDFLKSLLPVEA